jgi:hypothetical protein
MVKLSVKYRRNFMQIILTKDEYDTMRPNQINNNFADEISKFIDVEFVSSELTRDDYFDRIKKLKEKVGEFRKKLKAEQL